MTFNGISQSAKANPFASRAYFDWRSVAGYRDKRICDCMSWSAPGGLLHQQLYLIPDPEAGPRAVWYVQDRPWDFLQLN